MGAQVPVYLRIVRPAIEVVEVSALTVQDAIEQVKSSIGVIHVLKASYDREDVEYEEE